jgi:folate-dependent phosphoribosylglycinamide formyltransferase PurN
VAALAARVLKEEHRIYPQALDELARSLIAAREPLAAMTAELPRDHRFT